VARDSFVARNLPKHDWSGLFESGIFDGGQRTFPNGCHVVEVEIDEGTGELRGTRHAWLSI
jgi:CO/xanthine dehydrogenase Mo-binding subunit